MEGPPGADRERFERLALEQMDALYRVARRLTRDAARAEDLVQETYLRAFGAREGFELREFGIRPWLLRIMKNLHFRRHSRGWRQPVAMEGEALEAAGSDANTDRGDAPLPLDLEDLDENLLRALDVLPVDLQIVLLMWAVDELSYKQIAHTLDIPIGTVMSRLHRARQTLGRELREYAEAEGVCRR